MLNIVPEIVLQSYELGELDKQFPAYTVFADISGFTHITEELSKHGKIGAEVLTDTLNTLFDPVINLVYEHGGFITTFAGDAVSVVFPGGNRKSLIKASSEIIKEFSARSLLKTSFGEFKFDLKLGLGSGSVHLKIIEGKNRAAYYFFGEGIRHAVSNEEKAKRGEAVSDGLVEKVSYLKRSIIKPSPSSQYLFYPQEIVDGGVENAFRSVVSVFVNATPDSAASVIEYMLSSQEGIYLNKVDFSDKGFVMLVVFGAPRSKEDDAERSIRFARELTSRFPESVRVGMSYSVAYAGIVGNEKRAEYTVMGRGVNLAARLMQKAEYGKILIDRNLKNALPAIHLVKSGKIKLKGFDKPVEIFSVEKKSYYFVISEGERVIGQKKQKERIRGYVRNFIEQGRSRGRILIFGDEGSGKTTLAFYTISYAQKLNPNIKYAYFDFKLHADVPALELFKEFFVHAFGLFNINDQAELKKGILDYGNSVLHMEREEWEGIKRIFQVQRDNVDEERADVVQDVIRYGLLFLFKLLAQKDGILVVFDGLSDADKSAREMVEFLIDNIRKDFLSVIVGDTKCKPEQKDLEIHTSPLSQKDIENLIKEIVGEQPHSTLVEYIYGKSGGNLRIASEMVRLMVEKEMLEKVRGYITLKKDVKDLPGSLQHIFMARFDSLPKDVQKVLKVCAVYGNRFKKAIIQRAFYRNLDIKNLLMFADARGIISQEVPGVYIFREPLFRESIYSALTFKYLKKTHIKIARALERYAEGEEKDTFLLFQHFYAAESKRKAMIYGRIALMHAESMFSYEKVLLITERLMKLYSPSSENYIELMLKQATALYNLGRTAEAMEIYEQIMQNVRGGYLKGWALYKSAYLLSLEGKRKEAESRLKEAIKRGKRNRKILAMAYLNLGILYIRSRPEDGVKYLEKAIQYAELLNDDVTKANALMNMGVAYEVSGNSEEAFKKYSESYELYKMHKHIRGMYRVYHLFATYYSKKREIKKALDYYLKAYNIFKKYGIKTGLSSVLLNMGILFAEIGEFRKALFYFRQAEKLFSESGKKLSLAILYNNYGDLYIKKGNYKKAIKHILEALKIIENGGVIYYELIFKITLATAYVKGGELESSFKVLKNIEEIIEKNPKFSFLLPYKLLIEAELYMRQGDDERAMKTLYSIREDVQNRDFLLKADFLIWKITKDKALKSKLLNRLSRLKRQYELFEYKSMLKELSSDID